MRPEVEGVLELTPFNMSWEMELWDQVLKRNIARVDSPGVRKRRHAVSKVLVPLAGNVIRDNNGFDAGICEA